MPLEPVTARDVRYPPASTVGVVPPSPSPIRRPGTDNVQNRLGAVKGIDSNWLGAYSCPVEWIWEANGDNLIVDGVGYVAAHRAGRIGSEILDTFYHLIVKAPTKVSSQ